MRGFSLIEVLIAMLILSFAILASVDMQLSALRASYTAYLQSIAAIQVSNMMDRLRANPLATDFEFKRWQQENNQLLPHSTSNYVCTAHICTVKLQWQFHQIYSIHLSSTIDG